MNKDITCCFTGHRVILPDDYSIIESKLETEITKLIESGYYSVFETGGALGFDTLAAKVVLKLRKIFPHIKLVLVLPCKTQSLYWKKSDVDEYNEILQQADQTIYVSDDYFSGCMHLRNRYLIDSSSICIAFCHRLSGGSAYTVKYAMKNLIPVINLGEMEL